jgi:hypothetical protein
MIEHLGPLSVIGGRTEQHMTLSVSLQASLSASPLDVHHFIASGPTIAHDTECFLASESLRVTAGCAPLYGKWANYSA